MVTIGKKNSIRMQGAQVREALKLTQEAQELQQETQTLQQEVHSLRREVKKLQLEKKAMQTERKIRKAGGKKRRAASSLLKAASDPKQRAVMTKVWTVRKKRADHAAALLRLAIRYLNARDRTTIFRNNK